MSVVEEKLNLTINSRHGDELTSKLESIFDNVLQKLKEDVNKKVILNTILKMNIQIRSISTSNDFSNIENFMRNLDNNYNNILRNNSNNKINIIEYCNTKSYTKEDATSFKLSKIKYSKINTFQNDYYYSSIKKNLNSIGTVFKECEIFYFYINSNILFFNLNVLHYLIQKGKEDFITALIVKSLDDIYFNSNAVQNEYFEVDENTAKKIIINKTFNDISRRNPTDYANIYRDLFNFLLNNPSLLVGASSNKLFKTSLNNIIEKYEIKLKDSFSANIDKYFKLFGEFSMNGFEITKYVDNNNNTNNNVICFEKTINMEPVGFILGGLVIPLNEKYKKKYSIKKIRILYQNNRFDLKAIPHDVHPNVNSNDGGGPNRGNAICFGSLAGIRYENDFANFAKTLDSQKLFKFIEDCIDILRYPNFDSPFFGLPNDLRTLYDNHITVLREKGENIEMLNLDETIIDAPEAINQEDIDRSNLYMVTDRLDSNDDDDSEDPDDYGSDPDYDDDYDDDAENFDENYEEQNIRNQEQQPEVPIELIEL